MRNSFHPTFLRNDFPSPSIHHQGSIVSNERNAMIFSIGAQVDPCSLFPLQVEVIESENSGQGIWSFCSIIWIGKFTSSRHNRIRVRHLHSDQCKVQHVHSPVSHQATRIIPEPSKIKMEAIRIERSFGSWT